MHAKVWYDVGMKRAISSLLVVAMMASAMPAMADDPVPTPAPVVTPLNKSQPAPYTGVLLSPEAVAQVVTDKDAATVNLNLAVQHQSALDGAQLKFETDRLTTTCTADKKILQAQVDDNMRQINILNEQLKKQSSGPGAGVWIGVGTVGGVVLTVLTVFAVNRATK
jgi:hypothetical protein